MARTKQRLTAKEWLDLAEHFEIASHALLENRPPAAVNVLGGPYLTLRSFGIEAYFKCLIELGSRKPTKTHNFSELFEQLRPCDRRVLRERWRAKYGPKMRAWNKQKDTPFKFPVGLDGVLKLCGDAFMIVRYHPAEGDGPMPFPLMNFPLTIREYVFELKPEFRPARDILVNEPKARPGAFTGENLGPITAVLAELNRQAAPLGIQLKRAARMVTPRLRSFRKAQLNRSHQVILTPRHSSATKSSDGAECIK
jgi:hypothetical protein